MLSAFNPDDTNAPAPARHAYLVLAMTSNTTQAELNSNSYLLNISPIPGSAVTFTSSTGRRYAATRSSVTASDPSTSDNGMLDATYAFLVPSDTIHGVVSIGPATTSGYTYTALVNSEAPESLAVGGPVRFSVGLPTPRAIEPQSDPPWFSEPVPPSGPPSSRSSGSILSVPVAIAVLMLALGAALLVRRRRSERGKEEVLDAPVFTAAEPASPTTERPSEPAPLEGVLRVSVMGPIVVEPTEEPLTEFGRSLVCYLAVHADRPRTVDDVQTALWPVVGPHGDVTRKTFLNQVSSVRRAIGGGHLPGSRGAARYALVDASLDWEEFQDLVREAERFPESRSELLARAMGLVCGVPFESEVGTSFQWADTQSVRTAITRAVTRAAVDLHGLCVQDSNLAGAEWALRQGLRCSPFEPTLWGYLADVVQALGDPGEDARFWRDATSVLDELLVSQLRSRIRG